MAARRGGGFWRGFLFGLVIAALVSLGLAWAFPPLREPEVDERSFTAPLGPQPPSGLGVTDDAATGAASPEVPRSAPAGEP